MAEEALRLAADEPRRAVQLAEEVLAATEDAECLSVAERALGIAARELHDVNAVRRHLATAVQHAERAGLRQRAAEARLSLAADLVTVGRPAAALRELARAGRDLTDDHPQVHAQFAFIYTRLGHYEEALAHNTRALASAERAGDRSRMALVLANRGIAHGFRGDLANAERDLRRARALCEELGERFAALDAGHNLAWVLARAGRLPEALSLYDEAEAGLAELGAVLGIGRIDRAEALLAAGLINEAQTLARDAAQELAATGHEAELADALLLQARAALLAGDASASSIASDAAVAFEAQDRVPWALLSRAVEVQALARDGEDVSERAVALVAELERRGLRDDAQDVRLAGNTTALLVPLAKLRRSRSARTRTRAWQAELALRLDRGDRRAALSAAAAALRALDDLRSGLGATDLHASAAVHGAAIATTALSLAFEGSDADVLRWSEGARSTTLQHAPVRPPRDAALAADLEQLRRVAADRHQALLDGDPSAALHREQLQLEEAVRRRSRHALGARGGRRTPTLTQLRSVLAGRRLVSIFETSDRVRALRVDRRSSHVVDVCAIAEVDVEVRHLRLALRRAVLGHPDSAAAVEVSAGRLGALLAPALSGSGPLVVVPPPRLAAVPWTLLPAVAPFDVEVTPSVTMWCRPRRDVVATARVAVAGPDLVQAEAEVADIAVDDPTMQVLSGSDATAARVLAAMDGAVLAHLACHGRFRAENPLFSSLLLADGPVTVYDIERLAAAPEHVVLSACDTARLGQDLLGFAAAFFSLGTRTLIASVVPVDDSQTRHLMTALHRHWRTGVSAAAALRAAQRDHPGPTAAAFVCLTAGSGEGQTVSG